ncbi:hypothetical protein TNCV_587521 [Trichonephila clavipes]|nr:hypothetical protein TNCV_587521 [Trichonephila clavipes]
MVTVTQKLDQQWGRIFLMDESRLNMNNSYACIMNALRAGKIIERNWLGDSRVLICRNIMLDIPILTFTSSKEVQSLLLFHGSSTEASLSQFLFMKDNTTPYRIVNVKVQRVMIFNTWIGWQGPPSKFN